jgi:2',3'-cyclic-nucleotide 2'-phosphodiesterase (5'-nucleotidase family)
VSWFWPSLIFVQEKEVDLLLVDSGDLHDGSGLTDGYPEPGINGHEVIIRVV